MIIDELDILLGYLFDRVPNLICEYEIITSVFNSDSKVPAKAIILHLLENHHIYQETDIETNTPSNTITKYGITIVGINFYAGSNIKNKPYYSKYKGDELEKKTKKNESWQKRNWIGVSIMTLAFAVLIGPLISEWCKRKIWSDSHQTKTQILVIKDSVQKYSPQKNR